MKKRALSAVLPLALCVLISGCANDQNRKENAGTVIGAGLGALAGSQIGSGGGKVAAIGLGALFGGFVGNQVGKSMDETDRLMARQTTHTALEKSPVGEKVVWNNTDSGNSGTITPVRTFQKDDGGYCSEFQQTIIVGGQEEQAYGTACRQPDGSWKVQAK